MSIESVEVDQQSVGTVYDDVDAVFGFARLLAEVDVKPDEALKSAYHSAEVRQWYGEYLGGLLAPAFDRDIDAAWQEANE